MPSPGFRAVVAIWILVLATAATGHAAEEPLSATDLNSAGVDFYNARDWLSAIAHFEAALESAQDNPVVRRNLCNAHQAYAGELAAGSDFANAADQLERAVRADPGNPSPLVQLGSYFLRMELTTDAIYRLEEAVQLDAQNVDAHDLLGDAYYKDNDIPSALAQWEFVAEIEPNRRGLQQKLEKAYREESVEHRFHRSASRHFQISFAPGTQPGELNEVLTHLERAYRDIGRKFGGVYPPTPVQVIVYTAEDFERATLLGEHVAAVYDGKIRIPLRDRRGNGIPAPELRRRLFHEYTHVVVRYLASDKVPWWLNEGLAETFSDELTSFDVTLLQDAYRRNALIPLAHLDASQVVMNDMAQMRLAYVQSHATVQFLWRTFGQMGLKRMMDALAVGLAPEEALKQSYRRDYDMLQKEVVGSVILKGYQ